MNWSDIGDAMFGGLADYGDILALVSNSIWAGAVPSRALAAPAPAGVRPRSNTATRPAIPGRVVAAPPVGSRPILTPANGSRISRSESHDDGCLRAAVTSCPA